MEQRGDGKLAAGHFAPRNYYLLPVSFAITVNEADEGNTGGLSGGTIQPGYACNSQANI